MTPSKDIFFCGPIIIHIQIILISRLTICSFRSRICYYKVIKRIYSAFCLLIVMAVIFHANSPCSIISWLTITLNDGWCNFWMIIASKKGIYYIIAFRYSSIFTWLFVIKANIDWRKLCDISIFAGDFLENARASSWSSPNPEIRTWDYYSGILLFRKNNNLVVFQIPFHIFMPLANLWLIRLREQFPILRTRSCPDLYPLIRFRKGRWHLVEGESLSRDSFGPLLRWPSRTLPTLYREEV